MIKIEGGCWWYAGASKIKFPLTKGYVEKFDDLKKMFKFSKENFVLKIKGFHFKKIGYNFFINGKKVRKEEVLKRLF
jgi:hypothetical protein